jgi:hypothetical protein
LVFRVSQGLGVRGFIQRRNIPKYRKLLDSAFIQDRFVIPLGSFQGTVENRAHEKFNHKRGIDVTPIENESEGRNYNHQKRIILL